MRIKNRPGDKITGKGKQIEFTSHMNFKNTCEIVKIIPDNLG